jgi:hypothetical protein
MNRYSSRTSKLGEQFLNAKMKGAVSYDRQTVFLAKNIFLTKSLNFVIMGNDTDHDVKMRVTFA